VRLNRLILAASRLPTIQRRPWLASRKRSAAAEAQVSRASNLPCESVKKAQLTSHGRRRRELSRRHQLDGVEGRNDSQAAIGLLHIYLAPLHARQPQSTSRSHASQYITQYCSKKKGAVSSPGGLQLYHRPACRGPHDTDRRHHLQHSTAPHRTAPWASCAFPHLHSSHLC
jgi:hypothetical protein